MPYGDNEYHKSDAINGYIILMKWLCEYHGVEYPSLTLAPVAAGLLAAAQSIHINDSIIDIYDLIDSYGPDIVSRLERIANNV